MPDVRIEDLQRADSVQDSDYIVVGSGNNTYKMTVQTLKAAISPPLLYKRITAPGIYQADDDGVYGYGGVNVSIDSITGAKGDAELAYRTGYVNITPENLGLRIATVEETLEYLGIE